MAILAVGNQKGGVGKTTAALTLGAVLASAGRRVLLVDLDPQASLTQSLGIDAEERSLAEALGGAEPGRLALQAIVCNILPGLDLAPGDLALASVELGLTARMGRENVLRQALSVVHGYDLVLIDCPPSLGLLTVNGLAAAAGVLAPTLPSAADLRGLKLFLDTLEKVRVINPGLQLAGVIVSQYDGRLNAHQEALQLLERAGLPIWGTVPRSVRVQESQGRKVNLLEYDPGGKATAAYNLIAEGLEKWLIANEK